MNLRNHSLGAIGLGLFVALCCAAPASASHVDSYSKTDQKCRNAIAKSFGKAVGSADKVISGCHKNRDSGKVLPAVDCNDLDQADTKDKFSKAQTKLEGSVVKKCVDGGASGVVLEEFISCPDPCGTDLALPNPLTSYAQLGQCLACLAGDIVERRATVMLGLPTEPITKDEGKCHGAIAKAWGKHLKTLIKERQKCQKDEDTDGDSSTALQPCDTSDLKMKIAGAATKAADGVSDACTGQNLTNIDSCSAVDVASLNACLLAEDDARGGEAFASGYELAATICPIRIDSTILAGHGIGGVSRSFLNVGWTALAQNSDLVDHYVLSSDVTCAASPPCGDCTVDGISALGPQYQAFARCINVNLLNVQCTMPFQNDPACGGGPCGYALGPPLPLSSGGTPTCNVNLLANDISGTVNPDNGTGQLNVNLKTLVFTSGTITRPCQPCVGDTTPQDGIKDGHCSGTADPCDTQGWDASFAPQALNEGLSLDCRPTSNISGSGLTINLKLTTGHTELAFENACDSPLGAFACACGVCTGNTSFPCRNDTECADIVAGTCTTNGGGAAQARRPNECSDLTCTDVGNEHGRCTSGNPADTLHFCDGAIRADGSGYVTCTTNQDCTDTDPGCDDPETPALESCGTCTLNTVKQCFLDPIVADGIPDIHKPVLVETFCIPPTANVGVNSAAGLPGPARVGTDMIVKQILN